MPKEDFADNYDHFENFWCFTKFSFHHKWNEVWLLVINGYIRVALQVVKWLKYSVRGCNFYNTHGNKII